MNKQGILTLLGFAQKAGKLAAGEAAVENFLKKGRLKLLLLSGELSQNKQADWQKQAETYEITWVCVDITKIELGTAVGLSPRGIVGVMDQSMAEAIMKKIQD